MSAPPIDIVDDDRITAYGRLVEAQRSLHRIFDRSLRNRLGISIVWYEALLRLGRTPDRRLPINELGEAMNLTSGGATRLVDRLEESGHVARVGCPTDRRVSWAELTESGAAVVAEATEVHLADLEAYFASQLGADEMATLGELLVRVRPTG
jgi:DNA-binding MarR family transcriptional regulator